MTTSHLTSSSGRSGSTEEEQVDVQGQIDEPSRQHVLNLAVRHAPEPTQICEDSDSTRRASSNEGAIQATPSTTASSSSSSLSPGLRACPVELDLRPYGNPILWPAHRKAYHLVLCCFATMLTAYTAGSYSPPAALMETEFGTSRLAVEAGITTFCTGFALAPMVLAPFSEINGRYPVFAISGFLFVVFEIVCGFVDNLAGMLVARFLVGIGGSVFSTMIGGVIADLWDKEERNTPMALFSGSVLIGTGLGPLVSSVMVHQFAGDGAKWRWVFWHQVIIDGVLMTLIALLFKESRGSVVLSRRAKALNKWYEQREQAGYYGVWLRDSGPRDGDETATEIGSSDGYETATGLEDDEKKVASTIPPVAGASTTLRLVRLRWRVKADEERSSLAKMISISIYRPFHLLVTEPVVFSFSVWVSFAWAVLYLTFASIPYVYETVYGWNIESAGYIFAAIMIGSIIATIIGVFQDELLKHPQWMTEEWPSHGSLAKNNSNLQQWTRRDRIFALLRRRFPADAPESRLYFTCITATLLPIGLFIFGFTSKADIHWITPAVGICLATIGIYSVYLATFNYLADVYHIYASSALAAQSCCRNVLGGIFPLVTLQLFENLGTAKAGGLLGGIALVLTFVPWILVFFGPIIRARSAFAVKLEKASA
ncbi:major facilitator superfamily domain-containing protein [Coniella lustricola]|uniref:Major facilitator superfamily domain-containing protein n=1 Tax=Coniella lustricola TaxID=2025994 RepID=A0A2T3AAP0_9PEZI|nr:major facilitator superfamily domain-containing protein [Coniella lustricola]